jgi:hypothetical protein
VEKDGTFQEWANQKAENAFVGATPYVDKSDAVSRNRYIGRSIMVMVVSFCRTGELYLKA